MFIDNFSHSQYLTKIITCHFPYQPMYHSKTPISAWWTILVEGWYQGWFERWHLMIFLSPILSIICIIIILLQIHFRTKYILYRRNWTCINSPSVQWKTIINLTSQFSRTALEGWYGFTRTENLVRHIFRIHNFFSYRTCTEVLWHLCLLHILQQPTVCGVSESANQFFTQKQTCSSFVES